MATLTVSSIDEIAQLYGALLDHRKITPVYNAGTGPTLVSGMVVSVEEIRGIALRPWTVTIQESA